MGLGGIAGRPVPERPRLVSEPATELGMEAPVVQQDSPASQAVDGHDWYWVPPAPFASPHGSRPGLYHRGAHVLDVDLFPVEPEPLEDIADLVKCHRSRGGVREPLG
jgi:hypothetical protein